MLEPVWVGSKMPGKPWRGFSAPMCVLHTLEFSGFPDVNKWDSPSHYVYNPMRQELRQYVSTTKAAYSLRDNNVEDDHFTLQVEMFGRAASVPYYSDQWYEGVAALVSYVNVKYGIPLHFADFSVMQAGTHGVQRMSEYESDQFSGFMGHAHFGRGIDAHWDPGMLDIERVKSYLTEDIMPIELWHAYIDALFLGRPDIFKAGGSMTQQEAADYWKTVPPTSAEWVDFMNSVILAMQPIVDLPPHGHSGLVEVI